MLLNILKGLQRLQPGCIGVVLSACLKADANPVSPAPGRVLIVGMPILMYVPCLGELACLY